MKKTLLIIATLTLFATPAIARDVKVKIEANLRDAVKMMERLNKNGRKKNLRFFMVKKEEAFDFRIATESEGYSTSDMLFGTGGSDASAAVLTPDCELLFIVARSGRLTQSGALNAVSKEIVKKLSKYLKFTASASD